MPQVREETAMLGFEPPQREEPEAPVKLDAYEDMDGLLYFKANLKAGGSDSILGFEHIPAEDGSNTLLITDVMDEGSSLGIWNNKMRSNGQESMFILRGDRIAAVNGIKGDREAMAGLLREGSPELEVQRWPSLIKVALQRTDPGVKLGMQVELVQKADSTQVLRVGRIMGGLLGDWNQRAVSSGRFFEAVVPGSEIQAVGEISDDPEKMRDAVVSRDKVEIAFRRLDPAVFRRMSAQLRSLREAQAAAPAAG
jgi:hypothetical protein